MDASNRASKRIIVTGGGGRLGSRIVRHFAMKGEQVAAVVVSESESDRVPREGGRGRVLVKRADVTSEASISAVFSDIADEFGAVDALVHTVGMWSGGPLLETKQETWEQMIGVNLTSAFVCFREAVRRMDGPGTLIALASRQGADAGVAQQPAYSASKAGIVRLVEAVAAEFEDRRICAHAIAPSTILFDEEGEGVRADDIVSIIDYLITNGSALNGATIRTYGTG